MPQYSTFTVSPRPRLVIGDGKTVLLLGQELVLSDSELALLRLILSQAPHYITPNDIRDIGHSPSCLPTTVSNINKKAAPISGRKLIVSDRGRGYRLNQYI